MVPIKPVWSQWSLVRRVMIMNTIWPTHSTHARSKLSRAHTKAASQAGRTQTQALQRMHARTRTYAGRTTNTRSRHKPRQRGNEAAYRVHNEEHGDDKDPDVHEVEGRDNRGRRVHRLLDDQQQEACKARGERCGTQTARERAASGTAQGLTDEAQDHKLLHKTRDISREANSGVTQKANWTGLGRACRAF